MALPGIPGGNVTVSIVPRSAANDGSGGSYHNGCDFATGADLYIDATFLSTNVDPLDLAVGMYVA